MISEDLYHRITVKPSKKVSRRVFIQSALLGATAPAVACSGNSSSKPQPARHHLVNLSMDGPKAVEAARQAGASGVIALLDQDLERSYIEGFKTQARRHGIEPGFWIEIGRDQDAANRHPEWLHVPQHTDWLSQFPGWSGEKAAVFPWLPLNNMAVFEYQLAKVASLASMLEPGDSIYLNNVQNPPAGCGCGNLQCRSWDNSPGEKIAPSPYEHKDVYFTSLFMDALKARMPSISFTPIICPECEQGVVMGRVANPDAQTRYCNSINCSDPCGGFYYPGLVRALGGLDRVGLLCTYKALRRDLPVYGGTAAWVASNIGRYGEHAPVTKLMPVIQGWDVSGEEIKAQVDFVSNTSVRGYILARFPLDNTFWPVAVK